MTKWPFKVKLTVKHLTDPHITHVYFFKTVFMFLSIFNYYLIPCDLFNFWSQRIQCLMFLVCHKAVYIPANSILKPLKERKYITGVLPSKEKNLCKIMAIGFCKRSLIKYTYRNISLTLEAQKVRKPNGFVLF